jgi:hypothetical protein
VLKEYSSLRVTIEQDSRAMKNLFHILDNIPSHPYKTRVKLVLTYCITRYYTLALTK